jgi:N-acetylglucosaminyl-diphospho-decaprenol L-rhamnosyltransferase
MRKKFSLSIVSHGHQAYIVPLLKQLALLEQYDFEVILTLNVDEVLPIDLDTLPFKMYLIVNPSPKGFAANHNAAFMLSNGDNFVVLNPDIRLLDDPFPALLEMIDRSAGCICAPLIVSSCGDVEDSARNFPSPYLLVRKLMGRLFNLRLPHEIVPEKGTMLVPDWAAGMFLVIPRSIYQELQGFSERYFLYFEDVDFCARARLAGFNILVNKEIRVIHEAQRDSHRKLRFLLWHLGSAIKFFISKTYLKIQFSRIFSKR